MIQVVDQKSCLSELFCQTKIQKKANKKPASKKGHSRPLIFHPNRPQIFIVTLPCLGKAVYSYSTVKQRGAKRVGG